MIHVKRDHLSVDVNRLARRLKLLNPELRELEQRLSRAHRMQSLGILAGGVAHDFGNHLAGILAHASVLTHLAEPGGAVARSATAIETSSRFWRRSTRPSHRVRSSVPRSTMSAERKPWPR